MTPSDDLSPPRRPIFFPVVIATVFLTIIGMTGGFVLGERHRRELNADQAAPTTGPGTPEQPSRSPTGELCPDATRAAAERLGRGDDLRRVRRYETHRNTTIWICRDPAGNLYYQSRTGDQSKPIKQGQNGLFLPDLTVNGGGTYEGVTPDGNRFRVNGKQLVIEFASGETQEDEITDVQ